MNFIVKIKASFWMLFRKELCIEILTKSLLYNCCNEIVL